MLVPTMSEPAGCSERVVPPTSIAGPPAERVVPGAMWKAVGLGVRIVLPIVIGRGGTGDGMRALRSAGFSCAWGSPAVGTGVDGGSSMMEGGGGGS